jgi:eukaryotic-like serine/threonine-protein kinase
MAEESERIIGRYALGRKIASGGMATVHVGRVLGAIAFTRTVAIKRLHQRYATDPKFVAMFVDEARLTARVKHPNVVATLDVVVDHRRDSAGAVDGGEIFVVLDYVHGEPLHRLRKALQGQRLPIRIASGIAFGMLLGLHAAHDARNAHGEPLRIVHRDVSPQNVLVGPDGLARVLDFGIAKAFGRLRTTEDKEVKGKLAYLSPEQLRGEALDQRTDVYAASAVLWELITGVRLIRHEEPPAILTAILNQKHDPPSRYTNESTPQLDALVLRGLARNPADRWPTARAMALALEDCMPPATAPHIGAVVERIAYKALLERAAMIAEMEANVAPVTLDTVLRAVQGEPSTQRDLPLVPSSGR